MQFLAESLVELITQTSTNLPPDVREAMSRALGTELPNTQASQALNVIASNIDMAAEDQGPICQDTGMPTFVVHTPVGVNQIKLKAAIQEAVAEATRRGKLRPNSVDSLTGKNSGNNLGVETPVIHFHQWEQDQIEVKLILKGGGCENKNIQYSLPADLEHMGKAGRNLEGVRKCALTPAEILSQSTPAMRAKGRLAKDADADIVVFDYEKLSDRATFTAMNRPSEGVRHLVVSGQVLIGDGILDVAARPGKPVRRPVVES